MRRFSNAEFISRIRVLSRALAVFLRYLLSGGAFDLGFSFLFVSQLDRDEELVTEEDGDKGDPSKFS